MPTQHRVLSTLIAGCAALVLSSCGPQETEIIDIAPVVVENQGLGLRLTALPTDFAIDTNDVYQLVLVPTDPNLEGQVFFEVRSPDEGQNLPEMVTAHRDHIQSQTGGEYRGGQELISPLGTTFYSRGRFLWDEADLEETVIFALHPAGDRVLTITYRYPAVADSSIRIQQLFDVLAVVEGM